jgi:hypothetical protein
MEVSGQHHGPTALTQGRASSTHWIGGIVGLRPVWTAVVKRKISASDGNRTPGPTLSIILLTVVGYGKKQSVPEDGTR